MNNVRQLLDQIGYQLAAYIPKCVHVLHVPYGCEPPPLPAGTSPHDLVVEVTQFSHPDAKPLPPWRGPNEEKLNARQRIHRRRHRTTG